ncbi:transposase [Lysinibacillus sp. RC46]|uniref:IS66 family transposase n=1 Tax=Lysinibacillus sp. RC46 TaxID=3156295 RepID=UPI0035178ECF
MLTNDKDLSNWVIRSAEDWLLPVYEQMKQTLTAKSVLHVDETYAQIIKRSDGKSGQSNAYNWVFRSVPSQGPIIVLFQKTIFSTWARNLHRHDLRNFFSGWHD